MSCVGALAPAGDLLLPVQTAPRLRFLLWFICAQPHIILCFNIHGISVMLRYWLGRVCGGLCFYVVYLVFGSEGLVGGVGFLLTCEALCVETLFVGKVLYK